MVNGLSSGNILAGNTANNNLFDGFHLYGSSSNTLSRNTADEDCYGFSLYKSISGNTLSGNTANNNLYYGFYLTSSSDGNTLSGNTANGEVNGYLVHGLSSRNTLSGNTAIGDMVGFKDGLATATLSLGTRRRTTAMASSLMSVPAATLSRRTRRRTTLTMASQLSLLFTATTNSQGTRRTAGTGSMVTTIPPEAQAQGKQRTSTRATSVAATVSAVRSHSGLALHNRVRWSFLANRRFPKLPLAVLLLFIILGSTLVFFPVAVFAQPVACNTTITANTTLPANIGPCSGNGIIVGANGITLDCARAHDKRQELANGQRGSV